MTNRRSQRAALSPHSRAHPPHPPAPLLDSEFYGTRLGREKIGLGEKRMPPAHSKHQSGATQRGALATVGVSTFVVARWLGCQQGMHAPEALHVCVCVCACCLPADFERDLDTAHLVFLLFVKQPDS
eukprot:CAMPEP_0180109764 /NCGR_PEP_ID=MMETSP0985-20121206/34663_1 /TAXON_ID=483367 /ORGANISM="non described non described, Strain CCMP 2436" /LENGTH=126 /DNA_ID=CAMNT_0022047703 /DNA_START=35 /DNA_END=416 /DNA_ORIENTATION=-